MLFNFTLSCDANDGQVQIKIIDSFGWFESRRSSAPFELYLLKRVISVNNLLFKKKKNPCSVFEHNNCNNRYLPKNIYTRRMGN